MKLKDSLESVGIPVRDIYGREMGKLNGYTLDPSGNLFTIGVERGGDFVELPGSRVLSVKKEVTIIPEWKAEARECGFDAEALETMVGTISRLLEAGEISRRTYDRVYDGFVSAGTAPQALLQRLSRRLEELQRSEDEIDLFLARVLMQDDGHSGAELYGAVSERCSTIKVILESERKDLQSTQELIHRYLSSKSGGLSQEVRAEEELILPDDETKPAEPHYAEQEEQEPVAETYGSLRSLRA